MAEKDVGPRLGADPELFVQSLETGKIVPVCGKVGGTKDAPLNINSIIEARYGREEERRGRSLGQIGDYAVQEDNVMLEFNIPAYKEYSYFQNAIGKALDIIDTQILPARQLAANYQTTHTFETEEIESNPQAMSVGCLADMDAYAEGGSFERQPFSAVHFGNTRFCGGHLHVQYDKENVPPNIFAQFMDVFVELPFLRQDRQKGRRKFYGQPGIYRDKPYGIEYRTPSNFWLASSFRDKYLNLLADNVFSLARYANKTPDVLKQAYTKIDWLDVQEAIKSEDVSLADEILHFIRSKVQLGINMIN